MNPQQPQEDIPNAADQNGQPYDQLQGPTAAPQPQPLNTALPTQDYARPQLAPEQSLMQAEIPSVTTQVKTVNKVKRILIVLAVLIVLIVLVPVVISMISSPKLNQVASDTALKNDLSVIAGELNKYNSTAGSYPTATQFYDGTFRPEGVMHITASDAVNYVPAPEDCDAKEVKCTGFTLNMKLDSGKDYSVSN